MFNLEKYLQGQQDCIDLNPANSKDYSYLEGYSNQNHIMEMISAGNTEAAYTPVLSSNAYEQIAEIEKKLKWLEIDRKATLDHKGIDMINTRIESCMSEIIRIRGTYKPTVERKKIINSNDNRDASMKDVLKRVDKEFRK